VDDGFTAALFAGGSPSPESVSATAETTGIIDGLTVYLGVVLAAVVQVHPHAREERKMHEVGGTAVDERHLLIALFDTVSRLLKNAASGLQAGAPGAQEPECTEEVHENCEHRASPDQGRAVVFQQSASSARLGDIGGTSKGRRTRIVQGLETAATDAHPGNDRLW
jgi:hypothetical protein